VAQGIQIDWLGRVPYGDALELQHEAVAGRREHPPVVTLGRSTRPENLLTPRAELLARGVEVHEVARGGDVTYHGPGQLVGYAIVDLAARGLADVHTFLRALEAALMQAAGELGVAAGTLPGMTGVFVAGSAPPRKLASIGVGLRRWVTFHGFALNATLDPAAFGDIVPCGLHGVEMTSLARELGEPAGAAFFERVRDAVTRVFAERFA
jgi:lipoyl(octanoyl) transferase